MNMREHDMSEFERELRELLDSARNEGPEGSPDEFLAAYLLTCLEAHIEAIKARDEWFGLNTG